MAAAASRLGRVRMPESLLSRLEGVCTRVSTSPSVLLQHGKDESYHRAIPPDAVAYARTNEEVQAVVRLCAQEKVPIIPFGTGTSLEGHIQALHGGVTLDLSEMNRVLEVNPEDLDCRVEAGCTRLTLNEHLRHSGLCFPIDPGADASLGGMAACNASGTTAVRYGGMRQNVLGLTCVLADGSIMKAGGRARKSSTGYNLTQLLVGSEGTLGIITEIQLKLQPIPASTAAAVCVFETLEGAAQAVADILKFGIPCERCELLDSTAIEAFNAYPKEVPDLEVRPTLFLEFTGCSDAAVQEQAQVANEVCIDCGGGQFQWATNDEDRRKLWQARHSTYYASLHLRPGSKGIVTDTCVPISQLPKIIRETAAEMRAELGPGLFTIFGHAGDGNVHCILPVLEGDDESYVRKLKELNRRLVERSLAAGGSSSGEHGVGVGKQEYLEKEHGAPAVAAMRSIKAALDPSNILNPGKVVPPTCAS